MAKRALVLEDSRTQATIICKMFQKAGCDAVWVQDPASAHEALKAGQFDLLVLDVFIEGYNTLDHLSSFRELAGNVPIAVMTAGRIDDPESGADALNKARRGRVNFLLPKPFYFDDIKQICEDVDAYWQAHTSQAIAS
ncbi:response regulator [Asticcacaulis biprosthecium C19]|uniref:Response regulator n=1 Tax=Asticcacaulis biprosthecium C19 TaxID=715226 RepID=F4QJG7_9CAUL|nr:response regulator [Asticcacaulis biprosthecium]EGF93150.1 response regulator [Asticcacaulis biprosthecium C19]